MEMENIDELMPMIRKFEYKPIHKDDLKCTLHPKNCNACPKCVEEMKQEYKKLFTKNIHIRVKNPFYKEYVSDGFCDYSESFHHIDNPQYLYILDSRYKHIKKQREDIIKQHGENYLYHLVCKKYRREILNEYEPKKCVVESDGSFPLRRPKFEPFYMDFVFSGFDASAYMVIDKEEDKRRKDMLDYIKNLTDLNLIICKKIYDEFGEDKDKILEFINDLIKESK